MSAVTCAASGVGECSERQVLNFTIIDGKNVSLSERRAWEGIL